VAGIDADPAEFAQSQERPGSYRLWGGVETLFCWESKQLLPPGLVTTGVPSDARPGALGQPNTQVVFGPSDLSYGMFAGVRAVAGLWLDDGQVIGLEASGFLLEDRGQGFPARSTAGGSPLLALSRFDAPVGSADAAVITTPPGPDGRTSSYTGGIALSTDSQVWGSAVTLLHPLYWSRSFRLLVLGGLDYLDLRENLDMGTQKTGRGTSLVSFLGQRFDSQASVLTSDSFHVRSQFYGGQTGLRGEYILDRVYVSAAASLAVGRTDEAANVLGVSELLRKNAVPQTAPGGLYALPSNSGRFSDSDVGVIPEVQVKGGVLLQPWLRATVGYDFLYWNRVLRAGDQLDLNVDPRQVPTDPSFKSGIAATAPRPLTNRTDFWMQGLTFGLEITY